MSGEAFQIYDLTATRTGTLALCKQPETAADFAMIETWQPDITVTLTTEEFPSAGIYLPQQFLEMDYDWLHLPISDFGIPPETDRALWQDAQKQLQDILNVGGKILIHCKGGNGRSGMLVLKLLISQGESSEAALARLRLVRPNAVETEDQYNWAMMPL